jgi:hypothetical protein
MLTINLILSNFVSKGKASTIDFGTLGSVIESGCLFFAPKRIIDLEAMSY